jgi:hypothetical protein
MKWAEVKEGKMPDFLGDVEGAENDTLEERLYRIVEWVF